jgi:thiamine pyrophosphokinase
VAGGDMSTSDLAKIDREKDFIIAADGGAKKLIDAGIFPHLAVGDFDTTGESFVQDLLFQGIPTQKLPPAKDMTDTQYAIDEGLNQQPDEILILGALGGSRFDHTLANIGLLEWIKEKGSHGVIYNRTNRIQLLKGPTQITLPKSEYRYVSLIPVSRRVKGITTHGLLYSLTNGQLTRGLTLGISNEIKAEQATISIQAGTCLIIESRD